MRRLPALIALAAVSCTGLPRDVPAVFAASSLARVLPRIEGDAAYQFAGSDHLGLQIAEGAPADVFVAASPVEPRRLAAAGLLRGTTVFATNELVVALSAEAAHIRTPRDLLASGTRLVIGAPGVPAGDYARAALHAMGLQGALDNVVSEEQDAASIVAKLTLGEADAGFVYRTDAGGLRTMALPGAPEISYIAGVVTTTDAPRRAEAFVRALTSPRARALLAEAGFGAP